MQNQQKREHYIKKNPLAYWSLYNLPIQETTMNVSSIKWLLVFSLVFISTIIQAHSKSLIKVKPVHAETRTCFSRRSPCFLKRITCPTQCPTSHPKDPKAKVCYIDCYSPICKAECRSECIFFFHIWHFSKYFTCFLFIVLTSCTILLKLYKYKNLILGFPWWNHLFEKCVKASDWNKMFKVMMVRL